jgi:hypothetical protein
VTGKQTILFKKITATFLLLVLFAVTVIQVSHSHVSSNAITRHEKAFLKKSILPEYKSAAAESKCFICEYQLTRDADASYFVAAVNASIQYYLSNAATYSFVSQKINSCFETRGPPALV